MTKKIRQKRPYLIGTINFGRKGEPSRIIVEKILEKGGGNGLSKYVRDLIVANSRSHIKSKELLISNLKIEYTMSVSELKRLRLRIRCIGDDLARLGVDVSKIK